MTSTTTTAPAATHVHDTYTGPKGTTRLSGCVAVSPSGRYRVHFQFPYRGAIELTSSTVVAADSALEAARAYAAKAEGALTSCSAGTAEVA